MHILTYFGLSTQTISGFITRSWNQTGAEKEKKSSVPATLQAGSQPAGILYAHVFRLSEMEFSSGQKRAQLVQKLAGTDIRLFRLLFISINSLLIVV